MMDPMAAPQPAAAMGPPQAAFPPPSAAAPTLDAEESRRTSELKAFASYLGSSTVSGSAVASLSRPELARHLHRDDHDPTGGAICSLPGLDLNAGEDTDGAAAGGTGGGGATAASGGGSGLLPSLGASHLHQQRQHQHQHQHQQRHQQHHAPPTHSDSADVMPPPPPQAPTPAIPAMAASVFTTDSTADAVTQANTAQNSVPTAVTGMAMDSSAPGGHHNNPGGADNLAATGRATAAQAPTQSPEAASADAAKLEQAASRNLGTRTTWTRSSVAQSPHAMLRSLSSSFSSLVDSRVRAWTLLLLRHSLSSGDDASRSRLLTLLATSSSMDLTAVTLKFQCLELPPEMKAKLKEEKRLKAAARAVPGMVPQKDAERECDVVLPLIFEAKIDVTIQGQNVSVALRAPGTIAADFSTTSGQIKYLEVKLDTNALVACMVEQARLVVFKAVARATALPSTASGLSKHLGATSLSSSSSSASPLSGFNSALSLGGGGGSGRQPASSKASASAQRLQDLMTRKIDNTKKQPADHPTLGKVRKNRSVTWNTQLDVPKADSSYLPPSKRRKVTAPMQPSMKRSNKSFGKPDPDDFESVRNATFGEFGHAHKHSNVPTFVNGRLQVPNPQQQSPGAGMGGGGMGMAGQSMGNLSARGNATFNFNTGGGAGGGGAPGGRAGGQNSFFNLNRARPAAPSYSELARTATYSTRPPNRAHGHGLQRSGSAEIASGMTRRGSSEGMGGMTRTPTQLENMLLNATGTGSRRNMNPGSSGGFGLKR